MIDRAPVERTYLVRDATPREVYDVVVDFAAYPKMFPEFKAVRVLSNGSPAGLESGRGALPPPGKRPAIWHPPRRATRSKWPG